MIKESNIEQGQQLKNYSKESKHCNNKISNAT